MAPSPYYDRPRVESTPEGRRVIRWHSTWLILGTIALFGIWLWEMVRLWPDHGLLGFAFFGLLTTLAYLVIAALSFGVFVLGRFAIIALAVYFGLAAWMFGVETALLISVPPLFAVVGAAVQPRSATEVHPVEQRLLEQRIIGEPGAGLSDAIEKFGIERMTKGIAGEQITSDEFAAALDTYPVVQLVNGLKFPGSETADIDHAVVYGSKVALLDSKFWAGTDFRWQGDSVITAGRGRTLHAHEIRFPIAVQRLSAALPGKQVKGWVVIHSSEGHPISVEPTPEGLPVLADGTSWLGQVMSWLTDGQKVPADDDSLGLHCDTVKAVLDHKR